MMKQARVDSAREKAPPPALKPGRQIVGFSLKPERATEVKVEAARRGIPLNRLFEEMWALYTKHRT